jgi:(S)-mandelate dehydrogenase
MSDCLNIHDLRDAAKRRLPRAIFEFVERGSEDDYLIRHNRAALDRIRLIPRAPRDVSVRDQSVTLFGRKLSSPLIIAPTGIADLVAYRGEIALARAAAAAGIPFSLATSSTTSMEDIGQHATAGFWMQMYLWERRDLSWQVIERAMAAGAEALIVTVDTPVLPNREFNKRNGMANPIRPNVKLAVDFALHPRWMLGVLVRYWLTGGMPRFVNYPREIEGSVSGPIKRQTNASSVGWADIAEVRKRWPGKLLVKGLLNPQDAAMAVEQGADGVIVSNHGGRNFDASPAAIDVLPEIVDAVGGKTSVLFDSGIRRGTDVMRALAIGAKAVLIGRPTLFGAAVGGEVGAAKALSILSSEIDFAMAMLGIRSLSELDRSYVRVQAPGG